MRHAEILGMGLSRFLTSLAGYPLGLVGHGIGCERGREAIGLISSNTFVLVRQVMVLREPLCE